MIREKALVALRFPAGKNTVAPETDIPEGACREALNIDIDRSGGFQRRQGYTLRYAGAGIHSLGPGGLFVEGTTLKRLDKSDWSADALVTGLTEGARVSYAVINGDTYWSNGYQTGRVLAAGTAAPWGAPTPSAQPTAASFANSGKFSAGKYQVAVTFKLSTGEEGGTGKAVSVTISEGHQIRLASIPQSSLASHVRIYVSPPNGEVLFHHADLAMGTTTVDLSPVTRGKALATQFMNPMPAGQLVRYFSGRLWVASGSVLYYSEPLRPGLYRTAENFIMFPARVTVVEPVVDGLFVVADQTYFLSGTDPKTMAQRVVDASTGVEGTGLSLQAKHTPTEAAGGWLAYWWGSRGAMLGAPGGAVRALTERQLAAPAYGSGASLFRERQGLRQVVTVLASAGSAIPFAAVDDAVTLTRDNQVEYPLPGD